MYYYTYKITCTEGSFKGKFYFGQHRTNNLDDGYKGSGKLLLKYYKKHPNDFIFEILDFYDNENDLNKAEYDIIKIWLNDPMCLNLTEGGGHFQKGHQLSEETKSKISKKLKGHKQSEEAIQKQAAKIRGRKYGPPSDETRKKISAKLKGKKGHPNLNPATKGKPSTIKGKHRVYDNLEKTKFHFE